MRFWPVSFQANALFFGGVQDKQLVRIAGDDPTLQAQNDKNWEGFKNAFVSEFPTVPIPDVGDS
jgi:hypothetical protein